MCVSCFFSFFVKQVSWEGHDWRFAPGRESTGAGEIDAGKSFLKKILMPSKLCEEVVPLAVVAVCSLGGIESQLEKEEYILTLTRQYHVVSLFSLVTWCFPCWTSSGTLSETTRKQQN